MAELRCLWMSLELLLSAVQRDFEMEILLRRSELGAAEGCERETDDTISSGSSPHAYCQANLTQHVPPRPTPDIYTQVQTHLHTQTCTDSIQKHNTRDQ